MAGLLAAVVGQIVLAKGGIKKDEFWSLLGEMGCKYAQGYYFARPLPMDKLREFLQS